MQKVDVYKTYQKCPICGNVPNKFYFESIEVQRNDINIHYKSIMNFICLNHSCNHKWEE